MSATPPSARQFTDSLLSLVSFASRRKLEWRGDWISGDRRMAVEDKVAEVIEGYVEARTAEQSTLVAELAEALREVIDRVDRWNAAVESIIGKQPDTGIGLARAKAALAKVPR